MNLTDSKALTYFREKKTTFIDLDFPPNHHSIESSKQKILNKYEALVHWRRVEDFIPKKTSPVILPEHFDPNSVKSGKLIDGWILSSITALAERPKLIEKVFITKKANAYGMYKLRLRKLGFWLTIILDDYIPCFPEGEPIFGKCAEVNQLWVVLIEKAFAKMYGKYGTL